MRTLGDFGDQGARKLCRQQKRRENRVSVAGNRHLSRENRVICVSRETKKHKGGKNYKAVSHGVIKVCNLFGKAQSGKSAG